MARREEQRPVSDSPSAPDACRRALNAMRASRPEMPILETPGFPAPADGVSQRFEAPPPPIELVTSGFSAEAWILCRVDEALGVLWPGIRAAVAAGGAGPKVIATYGRSTGPHPVADLGAFTALPRMSVGAPADAKSAAAAIEAAAQLPQPVYLRIPEATLAEVSDGSFGFARAPELRAGSDLTIAAVGPVLGAARALADRLHAVGLEVRVLDGASVKPLDSSSILRAARETGAILAVEEHHALSGFGSSVASLTSSAYPVPVRRVGYPDLPAGVPPGTPPSDSAAYGVDPRRLEEAAWELLRAQGKVQ
jgi:transketolase C-terminal domain/subunit